MCRVYNEVGSLREIKSYLQKHNLNEFNSLNELLTFQRNYSGAQQQIISNHSLLIEEERNVLRAEIEQLENYIEKRKIEIEQKLRFDLDKLKHELVGIPSTPSNFLQTLINSLKKVWLKIKIRNIKLLFDSKIAHSVKKSTTTLAKKSTRYQFIRSDFNEAVKLSSLPEMQKLERIKHIIDEINPSIYGALGEQRVSDELGSLPDEYILINDFTCSFDPPIYNRQENHYIKSVQIDHILISPAGIFLIETKNWSENSLNNLSLRSPVEQIRRTSFALFKILNGKTTNLLNRHHWGDRKVSIRNLIVLINQKPKEEFQYVKILTLKELRSYVEYFNPVFSISEIQMIAKYLLGLDRRRY